MMKRSIPEEPSEMSEDAAPIVKRVPGRDWCHDVPSCDAQPH